MEKSDFGEVDRNKMSEEIGRESKVVNYQLKLLYQARYISGPVIRGKASHHSEKWEYYQDLIASVKPHEITWDGHEYLETIRDPEIWKETKACAESIGSFGIETIKSIATGFVKTKLKQHTGIEI